MYINVLKYKFHFKKKKLVTKSYYNITIGL